MEDRGEADEEREREESILKPLGRGEFPIISHFLIVEQEHHPSGIQPLLSSFS